MDLQKKIKRIIREEISEFDNLDWIKNIQAIEPYTITSEPNLYIDDSVVQNMDLPTRSNGKEKELGSFRWTSGGMNYKFNAVLYPITYTSGKKMWRVIGTSGDHGFGYYWITKRNTLGKRARIQIFKQIIDKYKLETII